MRQTLLAAMLALAVAAVSVPSLLEAQSGRWNADYLPNLPVVTQDGKTLKFYDDVIKGKIVLISFIYTNCPDICPLTTARLTQVEDQLGDIVGRDIFFVSMTVDPERDTPERLKEFATAFGIGPGWLFLTGTPEDVRAINYKLGDRSRRLSDHRNEIVLGNDTTGEWQRDTALGDLNRLVMTIRDMDPKWRDQDHTPGDRGAGDALLPLGQQPGQAHDVGPLNRQGFRRLRHRGVRRPIADRVVACPQQRGSGHRRRGDRVGGNCPTDRRRRCPADRRHRRSVPTV